MKQLVDYQVIRGGVCAISLLIFSGCSKETPVEEPQTESIVITADEAKFLAQADGNTKFDQEDIDRIIADAMSFFDETTPTRSGSQRTVASIEPLKMAVPSTTRGGETTTEVKFYHSVTFVAWAPESGYVSAEQHPDTVPVVVRKLYIDGELASGNSLVAKIVK